MTLYVLSLINLITYSAYIPLPPISVHVLDVAQTDWGVSIFFNAVYLENKPSYRPVV